MSPEVLSIVVLPHWKRTTFKDHFVFYLMTFDLFQVENHAFELSDIAKVFSRIFVKAQFLFTTGKFKQLFLTVFIAVVGLLIRCCQKVAATCIFIVVNFLEVLSCSEVEFDKFVILPFLKVIF